MTDGWDSDNDFMIDQCKTSEFDKDHGMAAHSCLTHLECRGERTCSIFGWCRGKALCTAEEIRKACSVDEEARGKTISAKNSNKLCIIDDDCQGNRICDESYW